MALHDGGSGVPVIFGCETRETGEIFKQRADGLFGLGNSDASVINQLVAAGEIDDMFSLCFGMVEGDGVLMLGDSPAASEIPLQHTPLVPSPTHPFYYNVRLDAISVGGQELEIQSAVFQEGYATVLDSGTTFTYIPTPAFQAFAAAVEAYALEHGLVRVRGPDPQYDDICFGSAPEHTDVEAMSQVFPSFGLHFAPNATLILGPLNYLFVHTFNSGKYCLGVFDNGHAGTLLGGITFRNVLVQYDRANGRVGFGSAACKDLGQQHRPPCSAFAAGGNDLAAIVAVADGDCEPEPGVVVPQSQAQSRVDADYADDSGLSGDAQDDDEHEVVMPSIGTPSVISTTSTAGDLDEDQELVNADEMDLGMSGFDYQEDQSNTDDDNGSSTGDQDQEHSSDQDEDSSTDLESSSTEKDRSTSADDTGADSESSTEDNTTNAEEQEEVNTSNGDGPSNGGGVKTSSSSSDGGGGGGYTSMNEDGTVQYDESDTNEGAYSQSTAMHATPLMIGLSVGTIAMLSSALMMALIRPGSREALQSLFPRFRRYQSVPGNDNDPESGGGPGPGGNGGSGSGGGGVILSASSGKGASKGMSGVNGSGPGVNGNSGGPGGGLHVSTGKVVGGLINAASGGGGGGGKTGNSTITLNALIGKQPPPAIAVISMTQLSSKAPSGMVGGSTTPRVVGLTTPQKLQRTNSNTAAAAAAALAEELAAMQGHTPRAGGGAGGQGTVTLAPHAPQPRMASSRGPSTPTRMQLS